VSGRKYERPANHFDPYSPIFSKRERLEILASDAALGLVLTGLGGLARAFGWAWLLKARPTGTSASVSHSAVGQLAASAALGVAPAGLDGPARAQTGQARAWLLIHRACVAAFTAGRSGRHWP
jgi:hypothetical protein